MKNKILKFLNNESLEHLQFAAASALLICLTMRAKMNPSQVVVRVLALTAVDLLANRFLMHKYYAPYNIDPENLSNSIGLEYNIPNSNNPTCRALLSGKISYNDFKGNEDLDKELKDSLLSLHNAKGMKDLFMLFVAIPLAFSTLQNAPTTLLQSTLFLGSVAFIKDFVSCYANPNNEPILFHNNLVQSVMQLAMFKGLMNGYEKHAQTFLSTNCGANVAKGVEYVAGLFAAMLSFGVKTGISSKFTYNNSDELKALKAEDRDSKRL